MKRENLAWSIGRLNTEKADILIDNDTVTKVHATLNLFQGKYYLIDNESKNGTYIQSSGDGTIVEAKEHIALNYSDIIFFGEFRCQLQDLVEASSQSMFTIITSLVQLYSKSSGYETGPVPMPDPKPRPTPPEPTPPPKPGKRMRCFSCKAIVFSNQPCQTCGSTKHIGDHV